MDRMQREVNIQLVRHAVVTQIFCPGCGSVLDTGDSFLIESVATGRVTILDSKCWEKARGKHPNEVEVTDGRTGSITRIAGVSQAEPEKSEASIEGEQQELFPC